MSIAPDAKPETIEALGRMMKALSDQDAAQHGVQPTADHASVSDSTETENVAGRGG